MLIEPKMSSGGRRAAEKSSCEHTYKMPGLRHFPHSGRAVPPPPDQSFSLPKAWAPRNRSVRSINISKGIKMLTINNGDPLFTPAMYH